MAWRPSAYLLEGELDNTTPGKVTGWMRFAGIKERVTFDLEGNFHRDIRGAKICLSGDGQADDPEAGPYMDSFSTQQTGKVGDMTAGLPPADFVLYPYIEWFGVDNGRVVIELTQDQVKVIGSPIPACESDPISRDEQASNMAEFLGSLSAAMQVTAVAIGPKPIVSDPQFTHWVVVDDKIAGEAHSVKPADNGQSFAYVRLFNMPECAEFDYIETAHLRSKTTEANTRPSNRRRH
mgnify:CR=1 FL=1